MPHVLLENSINVELQAQEPWPQPITLYQPLEVEQILLPDNANCLAVRALLSMCRLDFQIEARVNAEFMSPTGKVPFIKCGTTVVAEFDRIVSFLEVKGISLTPNRDEMLKLDMQAYISLVHKMFGNAELYICWINAATLQDVTKPRYGVVYPWPLNHILTWQKRREVTKRLNALGWSSKTMEKVCDDVEKCCSALSAKLDNKEYFSGKKPGELDALVYGHGYALVTANLPSSVRRIPDIIRQNPIIMKHLNKIHRHIENSSASSPSCADDFEFVSKDIFFEDIYELI